MDDLNVLVLCVILVIMSLCGGAMLCHYAKQECPRCVSVKAAVNCDCPEIDCLAELNASYVKAQNDVSSLKRIVLENW